MQIHKFFTGVYGLISAAYGEALTPLQKLELTYKFSRELGNKVDTFTSSIKISAVKDLAGKVGTDQDTFIDALRLAVVGNRVFMSPKIFKTITHCMEESPSGEYRSTVYNIAASKPVLSVYAAFQTVYNIKPSSSVLEKIKFALQFVEMLNIPIFVTRRKAPESEVTKTYRYFEEFGLCESEKDLMHGIGAKELKGGRFNITTNALEAARCCLSYHSDLTKK